MSLSILEALNHARALANHAEILGACLAPSGSRSSTRHVGAAIADAVLQSGLNYQSVVRPRVERIEAMYPEARVLSEVVKIVSEGSTPQFLLWKHVTKILRFNDVVVVLSKEGIECSSDLSRWLDGRKARDCLLAINGIGPKTYDYLCCILGMDRVAVDRHVRKFANQAGISISQYDELQKITSYAADLLGLSRRDFDAWIWRYLSQQSYHLMDGVGIKGLSVKPAAQEV